MQHRNSWMMIILLFSVALQLVGCTVKADYQKIEPYELIKDENGDLNTVILTEKASERLMMASAPVVEERSEEAVTVTSKWLNEGARP